MKYKCEKCNYDFESLSTPTKCPNCGVSFSENTEIVLLFYILLKLAFILLFFMLPGLPLVSVLLYYYPAVFNQYSSCLLSIFISFLIFISLWIITKKFKKTISILFKTNWIIIVFIIFGLITNSSAANFFLSVVMGSNTFK